MCLQDAGDASSRESGGAAGTLGLHHKGKAASGSASAADMGKAGSGLSATGLKVCACGVFKCLRMEVTLFFQLRVTEQLVGRVSLP
jgi:hypothetical protein